jgi:4-diphosphocytidyl-2-C-methyl-D-erythritol kinase
VTVLFRETSPGVMQGEAPAKVNLYLRVLAKRPDGFHDLETVMVKVRDLVDSLRFERLESNELRLTVQSEYPAALGPIEIPATSENLVLRAAALLQNAAVSPDLAVRGVAITLIKRIPPAAGLGGGSSDAALTLAALNQLWGLNFSADRLWELAAQLGSDVPFFLAETAAVLCTGRGEVLTPLPSREPLPLVIARPRSGLSTPAVYRACRPEPERPSVADWLGVWESQGSAAAAHRLLNSLQAPAEGLNPEVGDLRQRFDREGLVAHQMTGSGSAYFGVCASASEARRVAQTLRQGGVPWVVDTWTAS